MKGKLIAVTFREVLARNPSFVACKLDLRNYFGEVTRQSVLAAVAESDALAPLARLAHAELCPTPMVFLEGRRLRLKVP